METKNECVFCNILKNDKDKQIIAEGNNCVAIRKLCRSKEGYSNVNFMIISKEHIRNLHDLKDPNILINMIALAKKLSRKDGIERDFKIEITNGKSAGQTVFHLHIHVKSYEDRWFYN